MLNRKCLVIGASGFLGGHVTRQLVTQGHDVRVLVRETSDTRMFEDLPVEKHTGSPFDPQVLLKAVEGVSTVFYGVVDTRSWLRDSAPLWQTNVESLQIVLDTLKGVALDKFVFTSSFVTIGVDREQPANEDTAFNWGETAPPYVHTRVEAERRVLAAARAGDLPAVSCNVSNTYGPLDYGPTPHGKAMWDAARGKVPVYFDSGAESVGIEDAARALILAGEKGRVGERYIVSDRYVTTRELFTTGAEALGRPGPKHKVPIWFMCLSAYMAEIKTRFRGRENPMAPSSIGLLTATGEVSHAKATRELGWEPRPVSDSVAAAVHFYRDYFAQT